MVVVVDHGHMLRKLGVLQCREGSTRKSPRCLNVQDRNALKSPASLLHKEGQDRFQDRTNILLRTPLQLCATMVNIFTKLLLNHRKQREAGGLLELENERNIWVRFCDDADFTVKRACQPWCCWDKSRRQLVMMIQTRYEVMVGLR